MPKRRIKIDRISDLMKLKDRIEDLAIYATINEDDEPGEDFDGQFDAWRKVNVAISDSTVSRPSLYQSFCAWVDCEDPPSQRWFFPKLREAYPHIKDRKSTERMIVGLSLISSNGE